jgi:protein-S-isoprenylcysteine O-methyltransferase Ste14
MDSDLHGIWLILFATTIVVRKVHEARAGGPRSLSGIPVSEAILMSAWALLAAVAPFLFIFSDWLAFADYPFSIPPLSSLTGVAMFILAIWLLHASHRDLGAAWTPRSAPAEGGVLITDGIYAKRRHPMYAAHLLWAVAQSLILHNFIAGAGALVPLTILLCLRIPREEKELTERFGDDYRGYCSRTGRFWPRRLRR